MLTELVQFIAGSTVLALVAVSFYKAGREVEAKQARRTILAAQLRARRLEAELDRRLTHPVLRGTRGDR